MRKSLLIILALILVMCLTTAVFAANANSERQWESHEVDSGVVDPVDGYKMGWDSFYHVDPDPDDDEMYASLFDLLVEETDLDKAYLASLSDSGLRDEAHKEGIEFYFTEVEGLTDQIWAAQVEAKPGETGLLDQEFEAAYGDTYEGSVDEKEDLSDDAWGFVADDDVSAGYTPVRGEDYVGNYFTIEQHAMTTDGTLKRFIDISSPFDGSYVHEDFTVTGQSDVQEAFEMTNIEPGEAIEVVWHQLF